MAKIDETIKAKFMAVVRDVLESNGEEVLQVKSGTLSIPWAEGEEEGYCNITFSIPKGERGGEGYDGHTEAKNYLLDCEIKANKKIETERKKAEKIAKDKAKREAKLKEKEKGE